MPEPSLVNDREVYNKLILQEDLRRLRSRFDFLVGHPVWWIAFKPNGNYKNLKSSIEASYHIWFDPRVRGARFARSVHAALKSHAKNSAPLTFKGPGSLAHYCVPIVVEKRVIGHLGLAGLKRGVRQEALALLASSVKLIVENCLLGQELHRLTATIRPRAVALSTVHTVHRIINSTLNLSELISRLAHLTAQVLKAGRCAIYLVEHTGEKSAEPRARTDKPGKAFLVCRALVGYPKNMTAGARLAWGSGLEGRVAKTAETVRRKKFICLPMIDEDVIGVMHVSSKKDHKEFAYFDQEILTTLAEEAVIAIKNAKHYEEQKRVTLSTIQSLALILGTRIPNVAAPQRFLQLALRMAEEMRLSEEETQALHYATLLKDTAKIGIPEEILRKPAKLTGEEYRILREHPIKGAKIVQTFESLRPVVPIILYIRERYDGSGYPKGLKGDEIPAGARILSVLNAFEAIVMGRPYRSRSTIREAVEEITRNSGTQFDPKVVDIFVRLVKKQGLQTYAGRGRN